MGSVLLKSRPNGWISIALVQGIDTTVNQLVGNINTISIICGLLITVSVPLLTNPTTEVLKNRKLLVAYFSFTSFAIISHFSAHSYRVVAVRTVECLGRGQISRGAYPDDDDH